MTNNLPKRRGPKLKDPNRPKTLKGMHRQEYCALKNAIHRCHSTKNQQYKDYGGRGIEVCEEWHGSDGFAVFLEHIGPKPSPELTLDRIDNDDHYRPGNVRWASRSEQQLNRRPLTCVNGRPITKLTYIGLTLTLLEWAELIDVNIHTLRCRLKKGYPLDKALQTGRFSAGRPPHRTKKNPWIKRGK